MIITGKLTNDNQIPGNGMSTEYHGGTTTPGDDMSTEYYGVPEYVFIIGGIFGVLLIISIIVGILLRRNQSRNVQKPGKENVMTNMNQTKGTTQGNPGPENNQQAYLMNSPDANHMSASHAFNLVISTDESNTYSHLRSTLDDFDVMYDHTVRHYVHDTCDGEYGIAHRRITEDDYDVSGNYLQSLETFNEYSCDQMAYVDDIDNI
ncbi:unnamed protein product [Mytilus coruscus]|uniref:Uncharacterized protein n=1 Tax=Mytilus coruscus TaxID=42192 RepID=A0A6J8D3N5_MYTCO|nr:unnamed protein product [Mytilus coruscus]